MGKRLDFHEILVGILGSRHVYYQGPGKHQMQYPAIVYQLDDIDARHADNLPYTRTNMYQVTVIDKDPDSPIHEKVGQLPLAGFDRKFVADNLNHFSYNVYF